MKIHEYQAKGLLAAHGVPVPRGEAVRTARAARRVAKDLGGKVVVKAQIHAGGRGKGRLVGSQAKTAAMFAKLEASPAETEGAVRGARVGGVRLAGSPERAEAEAKKILGKFLVTHQTGTEGRKVQRVLIEEQFSIAEEYYAAVLIDSALGAPVMIASSEGGQAIEEVAARNPKEIIRVPIDAEAGFPAEHVAFVTAYLDRSAGPFKKTVDSLAWGSYAWFAAEPENLIVLSQARTGLQGRP